MNLYTWVQEQKIPTRMSEMSFENELKRSIMDINNAKGENLVQFMHLILDKLIALMVRPPVIGGNVGMCHTMYQVGSRSSLFMANRAHFPTLFS